MWSGPVLIRFLIYYLGLLLNETIDSVCCLHLWNFLVPRFFQHSRMLHISSYRNYFEILLYAGFSC
jgi:hypothetical protein